MKRLVLLLALFLGLFATAQKMTPEFLDGQWTSNGYSTNIIFKNLGKKGMYIKETSSYTNEELKVIGYQIAENNLYIETLFERNNWKAISKYIIIDKNTMVADVVSDAPDQVIYKRVISN